MGAFTSKVIHLAVGYLEMVNDIRPETSAPWHMSLTIGLFIACYPVSLRIRGSKRKREAESIGSSQNLFLINLRSDINFSIFNSLEVTPLL